MKCENILQYFATVQFAVILAVISENSRTVTAIIFEEKCIPHQIAELENYLEEKFDMQDATMSNIKILGIDDSPVSELSKIVDSNEIELSPFGTHLVDWKRLRILYDLLTLPEDEIIKSKLLILYNILIAANQRLRTTSYTNKNDMQAGNILKKIDAGNTGEDEASDLSFDKNNEDFGNMKIQSLTTTTDLRRPQRSTYNENYSQTDPSSLIKYENENVSSLLTGLETTTNYITAYSEALETLDLYNDLKDGERLDPDSGIVISQLEELDARFGDTGEYESTREPKESYERVTIVDNFDFEKSETTDSNLEKTTKDATPELNTPRYFIPTTEIDFNDASTVVLSQEHRDYYNRNDVPGLGTTGSLSEQFTSPSLLLINRNKQQLNVEEASSSGLQDSSTPPIPVVIDKVQTFDNDAIRLDIHNNSMMLMETLTTSRNEINKTSPALSTIEEDSLIANEKEADEFSFDYSNIKRPELKSTTLRTTNKTLISKISDLFSNPPKTTEHGTTKNLGAHMSRVNNFWTEEDSRINSLPDDDDDKVKKDFHDKNNNYRVDQKSIGNIFVTKFPGFLYSQRNPPSRKHGKRGRDNTDIEKLYRWFYRAGFDSEKSNLRDTVGAVIECERRS